MTTHSPAASAGSSTERHVLGPVGRHQQGLGPRRRRRRVGRQEQPPQLRPDVRRAGLVGEPGPERAGQGPGLGRLAAAVDALERDQATPGRHLRRGRSGRPSSPPWPSWRRSRSWRPRPSWPRAFFGRRRPSSPPPSSWRAPTSWRAFFFLRGPGGPALGQQLGGPVHVDGLDRVALAQAGVGGAVGHVGAEAALLHDDGQVGGRVGAELAQRRCRRPAPALLGLGEERPRLVERDGEELVLAASGCACRTRA